MAGKTFSKINNTVDHAKDMVLYNKMMFGSSGASFYTKNITEQEVIQTVFDKTTNFYENMDKYGLTYREGQENFSLNIIDLLDNHNTKYKNLVIEAGVGIGKSYAYLIPLFYYIKNHPKGKRVIISTSTIALQEQLINDIENLKKMTGLKVSYRLVKGMNNYICLDKLKRYPKLKNIIGDSLDRKDYPDISDYDWNKINVDSCKYDNCIENCKCDYYDIKKCLTTASEDIIICNHNMLIEYLHRNNNSIKTSDIIVCDEAHNLENIIKDYNTNTIDIYQLIISIKRETNNSIELRNIERGILREISNQIQEQITLCNLEGTSRDELDEIKLELNESFRLIIYETIDLIETIIEKYEKQMLAQDFSSKKYYNKHLDIMYSRFSEYKQLLINLVENDNITWIEIFKNKYKINYIDKKIFEQSNLLLNTYSNKAIFTSATINANDDYLGFVNGTGLDLRNTNLCDTEVSPYDYDNNSILYVPKNMPNPKEKDDYLKSLAKEINKLIELTDGKTLVLFTSKMDMNAVYNMITKKSDRTNIYIQNDGSSQEEVKEKFKNDINSVLFSTGTFWEGIDIKGESLSNLIIAKLPFPVVSPYLEFKKEINEPGGFKKVYLNEMLIKLKQGCGRLIRSEDDLGIITILDSRAYKYYNSIINNINTKNWTSDYKDVKKFVKENIKGIQRKR